MKFMTSPLFRKHILGDCLFVVAFVLAKHLLLQQLKNVLFSGESFHNLSRCLKRFCRRCDMIQLQLTPLVFASWVDTPKCIPEFS